VSRYVDGDCDEPFPNAYAMFRANADRALKSKRGRAALADLREALMHLPEKRLIDGAVCTVDPAKRVQGPGGGDELAKHIAAVGEGVCAVGAYAWWRKVKAGADPQRAFDMLPTVYDPDDYYGEAMERTAELGRAAGLAFPLAWDLAYMNDEQFDRCTPEQRYEKFLAWIDRELSGATA
jgi:hypothetical protein